ncbi:hypothetical protein CBF23_007330 [Marinomonas agarivorans]|nr:hypothetical protein CBF23_007330 [Marinomonas agarivorans]
MFNLSFTYFSAVLCVTLLLFGCAVVPQYAEEAPVVASCDLYTKELELNVIDGTNAFSNCSGDGCEAALVLAAGVFVSSAVVSGSIYLVGNTLHWLEKETRCSEEDVQQESAQYDDILKAVGGKNVTSQDALHDAVNQHLTTEQ